MQNALKSFENLSIWSNGEQRAPHKPLLLLLALGKYQQHRQIQLPFEEVEPLLRKLLIEFGPSRQSYHPEYPFWALQQDDLWILNSETSITLRKGSSNPSKMELLKKNALGALNPAIIDCFNKDPKQIQIIAKQLLLAHFPDSLHRDITNAIGLDITDNTKTGTRLKRDPKFREEVLIAYEYKCAICSMDIRLGSGSNSIAVGLEAAHIMWHQAGGADTPSNGLALCSLHHKLLDHGAYTILDDYRILVSERAHGGDGFSKLLLNFHGQDLRKPIRETYLPSLSNLKWHRKEVFKPEGRELN